MKKIPKEAITRINFANQCDINEVVLSGINIDILEYERKRVEMCITDFVKQFIKIEQIEVKPGTYETKGTLIVIDQDKIETP